MKTLGKTDKDISLILNKELDRQRNVLELIPSENIVSTAVLEAMGSIATNKYSEGYPKKRYYGGNEFIDDIETVAIERAKELFKVPHANVQPYSGSPANFAVYTALCKSGDTIMGQNLIDGGHLTHGWKASITGQFFNSIAYHVKEDGFLDLNEIRKLAIENKPKIIWVGSTAYTREFPFKEFGKIANDVGAYLIADISHISGLVISGFHKSPVEYADVITTTTHKTLRGPRGGMIMVTKKGLEKDPELAEKIDKAVFPGLQGGPHENTIAAIAVALKEAETSEFKEYCKQIIKNSKALAKSLIENGIDLVTNGTDNHMILIDLRKFGIGKGIFVQEALDMANITTNKNTVPKEPMSAFYPSGLRIGTPTITTRGMKESEMNIIGKLISEIIHEVKDYSMPDKGKKEYLEILRKELAKNKKISNAKKTVIELCSKFPIYQEISY